MQNDEYIFKELTSPLGTLVLDRMRMFSAQAGAPTVNDDVNSKYRIGYRWLNTSDNTEYLCVDQTAGAAVWIRLTRELFESIDFPTYAPAAPPVGFENLTFPASTVSVVDMIISELRARSAIANRDYLYLLSGTATLYGEAWLDALPTLDFYVSIILAADSWTPGIDTTLINCYSGSKGYKLEILTTGTLRFTVGVEDPLNPGTYQDLVADVANFQSLAQDGIDQNLIFAIGRSSNITVYLNGENVGETDISGYSTWEIAVPTETVFANMAKLCSFELGIGSVNAFTAQALTRGLARYNYDGWICKFDFRNAQAGYLIPAAKSAIYYPLVLSGTSFGEYYWDRNRSVLVGRDAVSSDGVWIADTELIPSGWSIEQINIRNSTANSVTINIGTTAGGNDIYSGLACGANALTSQLSISGFNVAAATAKKIYFSSASWNSANLYPQIIIRRNP